MYLDVTCGRGGETHVVRYMYVFLHIYLRPLNIYVYQVIWHRRFAYMLLMIRIMILCIDLFSFPWVVFGHTHTHFLTLPNSCLSPEHACHAVQLWIIKHSEEFGCTPIDVRQN